MARDVSAPHLAALRMQLLERQSNTLPEALESLIWAYFLPLTVDGPDKCVREKLYQLPLKFEPIATSSLATGWLTGMWEHDKRVVRIGPGAKRAYGPFGRARGQVGEAASGIKEEVLHAVILNTDLYYVTLHIRSVLQWQRLHGHDDYDVMPSLIMSDSIGELKSASGHLFLLLETGSNLYMVTSNSPVCIEVVGKLTGVTFVRSPLILRDRYRNHILQDVLIGAGHVTHVLFVPGDHRLFIWRPDDDVFETNVPMLCCCRFVPSTNGTVVAGVFGDYGERGFNIFNIYENKVPAMSLDAEKGRVISVVISPDWQVSVMTYNDTAPQGSRGAATIIKLSHTGAKTYDHGFNHHVIGDSVDGYDSDGDSWDRAGSGLSSIYDYYDFHNDPW
ncbi:hypothetical protein FOZ63_010071 [Perkinsus olseni]|uniref:Uncharacterized protein n=2 Tax=Perkinsus olseni TaxID=32597 RepID=A0A7J6TZC4_PEROL|nr:hypothetical protein FOZ63_010071 [Perkinsus olseni]